MRCTYHPEREAVVECSQCKKPLCEECAKVNRRGSVSMCGTCVMRAAAEKAAQSIDERKEEKEEKKQVMAAKRGREKRLLWILTASLAAVVLLANLYLYFSPEDLPAEPFDPNKDLLLTAHLINAAIQDYAEAHAGQFPDALTDLLKGGHLPSEKITEAVLREFAYKRPSPLSYELRIRGKEGGEFSDVVFTQEDK